MDDDKDGDWVAHADYADLAERCQRLDTALRYVQAHISGVSLAIDECNDVLGGAK